MVLSWVAAQALRIALALSETLALNLIHPGDQRRDRYERVVQQGTFNALPLATATGIVTLRRVEGGRTNPAPRRLSGAISSVPG